jgi:ammonium transporter, Amt family
LLTGVFAEKSINTLADGLLYGNPGQLLIQATAVLAAMVYSGVVSFVLLKLIGLVIPLSATASEQVEGIDISAHGEEAYMHASGAAMLEASGGGDGERAAFKPARSEV